MRWPSKTTIMRFGALAVLVGTVLAYTPLAASVGSDAAILLSSLPIGFSGVFLVTSFATPKRTDGQGS